MTDDAARLSGAVDAGGGHSESDEGFLRQGGRGLLLSLYAALRSLKLYPVENETVQNALDELMVSSRKLLDVEGEIEVPRERGARDR